MVFGASTAGYVSLPVLLVQSGVSNRMDNRDTNETGRDDKFDPSTLRRIREIQEQIADLKKRWPAHSTPPGMMLRLDELEEELEKELGKATP
jgi:hypothetical protein